MKLKFINLLLASVLFAGSAQVFTSCKDNEADVVAELKETSINLNQKLEDDARRLTALEAALKTEIGNREQAIKDLAAEIAKLSAQIPTDYVTSQQLKDAIADATKGIADNAAAIKILQGDIININTALKLLATKDDLNTAIGGVKDDLNTAIGEVNQSIENTRESLDKIKEDILKDTNDIVTINTQIGEITVDLTSVKEQVAANIENIKGLGLRMDALELKVTTIESTLENVQNDITSINDRLDAVELNVTELLQFMNEWKPLLGTIQQNASEALATANANAAAIESMKAAIEALQKLVEQGNQQAADAMAGVNDKLDDLGNLVELGNQQAAAAVADLQSQIDAMMAQMGNYATLAELEEAVRNLQAEALAYYQQSINFTVFMCAGLRADMIAGFEAVDGNIADINNNLAALDGKIDTSVATLQAQIDALEKAIANGDQKVIEDLTDKILALDYRVSTLEDGLRQTYANLIAWIKIYDEKLANIEDNYSDLFGKYDELTGKYNDQDALIKELQNQVADLQDQIDALVIPGEIDVEALKDAIKNYVGNAIETAITNALVSVKNDISDLQDSVSTIEESLETLSNRIEQVAGRINSIIIQQTDNAIFGTLNLPIGINSQMLLAYASDKIVPAQVKFPTASTQSSYDGDLTGLGLAAGETLPYTGSTSVNTGSDEDKDFLMEIDPETGLGVLGTVYLTVNPANVDLKGKTFNIVNSRGDVLPIQIAPVASDKELNFGYTRAAANGFYEAKALVEVNEANLSKIRFTLNSKFKSTVAGILKDAKSLKNPSTIANLASAVYAQVNGVLPALGLQASWTEGSENMVVTSQYGLAAATFNPLSLKVFNTVGSLPQIPNLPDFGDLSDRFDVVYDQLVGKLNIKLNAEPFEINIGNVNITMTTPQISFANFDDYITGTVHVNTTVEVPFDVEVTVKDGEGNEFTGQASGKSEGTINKDFTADVKVKDMLESMQDAVNAALVDAMGEDVGATISAQINTELEKIATTLEGKVNDLLDSMQSQIDTAFDTIKNFADGKLNALENRLGQYTDRVQALINRINGVLADPGHYVQPVLLYRNNGKLGRMSSAINMPTVLNSSVANPGLMLIPTTYTLETVVPLYQKYVAVTKVWANGDATRTNVPAVQNAANNTEYMNTVVKAQCHHVPVSLQKGYTYEIYYQGLDYAGLVSGHKYYVCVK